MDSLSWVVEVFVPLPYILLFFWFLNPGVPAPGFFVMLQTTNLFYHKDWFHGGIPKNCRERKRKYILQIPGACILPFGASPPKKEGKKIPPLLLRKSLSGGRAGLGIWDLKSVQGIPNRFKDLYTALINYTLSSGNQKFINQKRISLLSE